MPFYVYILKSKKDDKRYIGMTEDLERRLAEHSAGKVKSTRNRRPLELVHTEEFALKENAHKHELFLKTGKSREYLKAIGI